MRSADLFCKCEAILGRLMVAGVKPIKTVAVSEIKVHYVYSPTVFESSSSECVNLPLRTRTFCTQTFLNV